MWHEIANIVGLLGVALILIAYVQIQMQRKRQIVPPLSYSLMNLVGAVMILFSLCFAWNLASFVIECFWILISVYGIFRWSRVQILQRSQQ